MCGDALMPILCLSRTPPNKPICFQMFPRRFWQSTETTSQVVGKLALTTNVMSWHGQHAGSKESPMSSITSLSYHPQFQSPLDRLQNELASEVSAGTISSSDAGALSSALNAIDSSLQSDASSSQSSGASRPSPADMKTKIDSLIQAQVQSGNLTSNQASELQNVFANAFSQGGPGGAGGSGG